MTKMKIENLPSDFPATNRRTARYAFLIRRAINRCNCNSFDHLINSPANYCGNSTQAVKIPSSTGGRRRTTKSKKCKLPLFGKLSRSSWDFFESDSDSKESRDDRLNSSKSGIFIFLRCFHVQGCTTSIRYSKNAKN